MTSLNLDNSIPMEFTSAACGEFSSAFSSSFPVCSLMGGDIPIESTATILADGVLNIELLSQIGIDKQTAIELLTTSVLKIDCSFPVELLATIDDDEIIPLSYLGIGVPVEALTWLLESRATVWLLDSREDIWSPVSRETLFSLEKRSS